MIAYSTTNWNNGYRIPLQQNLNVIVILTTNNELNKFFISRHDRIKIIILNKLNHAHDASVLKLISVLKL